MSVFAPSYSRAFFEAIPPDYDVLGFLEGASAVALALSEDARLKAFVTAPAVPEEAKRKVIEELSARAGLDEFGRRFFAVLLAHRRLTAAAEILAAIRRDANRRAGVVEARVTVAGPVGEPERRALEEALARAAGRRVRLTVNVDQEILAGFVARIGSEIFDASALRAIDRFREGGRVKEG